MLNYTYSHTYSYSHGYIHTDTYIHTKSYSDTQVSPKSATAADAAIGPKIPSEK